LRALSSVVNNNFYCNSITILLSIIVDININIGLNYCNSIAIVVLSKQKVVSCLTYVTYWTKRAIGVGTRTGTRTAQAEAQDRQQDRAHMTQQERLQDRLQGHGSFIRYLDNGRFGRAICAAPESFILSIWQYGSIYWAREKVQHNLIRCASKLHL
jgi:hypothetical protein